MAGDLVAAGAGYRSAGLDVVADELRRWVAAPLAGVGRNAPCPCGSGRKFKQCCLVRPPALDLDERVTLAWWKVHRWSIDRYLALGRAPR